jgi:hypothetical protein
MMRVSDGMEPKQVITVVEGAYTLAEIARL